MNILPRERVLFAGTALIAALFWLGLALLWLKLAARLLPEFAPVLGATTLAGVAILAYLVSFLRRAARVGWLRGNGIEISAQQHADLFGHLRHCAKRLGRERPPRAYLFNDPRRGPTISVVWRGEQVLGLNAARLPAPGVRAGALDFFIGFELTRLYDPARAVLPLLAPATVIPVIGPAAVRARVYFHDRAALGACRTPGDAALALADLAGGVRGHAVRVSEFLAQLPARNGFWESLAELVSPHPTLARRLARLRALTKRDAPPPPTHPLVACIAAAMLPPMVTATRVPFSHALLLALWLVLLVYGASATHRLAVDAGWVESAGGKLEGLALKPGKAARASAPLPPVPAAPAVEAQPYVQLNHDLRLLGEAAAQRSGRQGAIVCEIDNIDALALHFRRERYALSCSEPIVYTVVEASEFEPGRSSFLHAYHWRDKRLLSPALPPAPTNAAGTPREQ